MVLILSFLLTCIHALDEVDNLTTAYLQIDKTPIKGWNIMRPFTNEDLNIRNWNFGGDTIVNNDKFIRLTDDSQSRTGSLWSNLALETSYFTVEFDFQVIYQGGLSGDGFAFWVSPEKGKPGPVFGREDQFKGIGFLFDEYPNSRVRHTYPYITVMAGDGQIKYDHDYDGQGQEAGGCHFEYRNTKEPTKIRIISLPDGVKMEYKTSADIGFNVCFVANVTVPSNPYLGFTAMTGGVSARHEIIVVEIYKITDPYKHKVASSNSKFNFSSSSESEAASSSGFFTKFILFALIGVLGYTFWVMYKASKRDSYKRF